MKKLLIVVLLSIIFVTNIKAEELKLAPNAKSAMMIEASTGTVIFEKNIHEKYAPASMTKMMSMILFMEAIENGKMSWDEKIRVSKQATGMGGSQIFLEENELMTVKDMFKGIAIASANDATVALAERVGGTEANFVVMMNTKSKALGLKNTNFKNSHGLDEENHYSTAYDMMLIARELIKYEKVLEYSKIYETYLRANTDKKTWLVNTNKLVRFYEGMDGLKTGNTDNAGFCLTATAKRNDMRLIAIVFGEPDSANRNKDVSEMLDYGFNSYDTIKFMSTDESVGSTMVSKGLIRETELVPLNDVNIIFKKAIEKKSITYKLVIDEKRMEAPIKRGNVVGEIKIFENGNYSRSMDLTVPRDIIKINFFSYYARNLIDIMSGKLKYYL